LNNLSKKKTNDGLKVLLSILNIRKMIFHFHLINDAFNYSINQIHYLLNKFKKKKEFFSHIRDPKKIVKFIHSSNIHT